MSIRCRLAVFQIVDLKSPKKARKLKRPVDNGLFIQLNASALNYRLAFVDNSLKFDFTLLNLERESASQGPFFYRLSKAFESENMLSSKSLTNRAHPSQCFRSQAVQSVFNNRSSNLIMPIHLDWRHSLGTWLNQIKKSPQNEKFKVNKKFVYIELHSIVTLF